MLAPTGGPTVCMLCLTVCLTCCLLQLGCKMDGNSGSTAPNTLAGSLGRSVGLGEMAYDATVWTLRCVDASDSRLRPASTRRLNFHNRSAFKINCLTLAITKTHGNDRRRPRSRVRDCVPNIVIEALIIACKVCLSCRCLPSVWEGGVMLTLTPVSTRKRKPLVPAVMENG